MPQAKINPYLHGLDTHVTADGTEIKWGDVVEVSDSAMNETVPWSGRMVPVLVEEGSSGKKGSAIDGAGSAPVLGATTDEGTTTTTTGRASRSK